MFSLSIGLIYLELWKIRHSLNINHIIGSIWSSFGSSRLINVAPFKSIDICFDVFSLLLPIVVFFQCYNFTPNQLYERSSYYVWIFHYAEWQCKVFRICVRFFPCLAKNANNYFFMLQMCWTVAIELRIKWNSNHTSFVRWNCKEMRKMLIFCVIWDRHGGGRYWPVFFSLSHSNKSKHGHIFPFSSEHQWHQRTNWTLNTGLVYWSRVWLLFIFCFTSEIQHEIDPNSN